MRLRQYQRKYSLFGRRIWPSAPFFKVRLNAAKITLMFAALGSLILFSMDYRNQQFTRTLRSMLVDATLPLVDVSSELTQVVGSNIKDLLNPYKKYERQLKEKDENIQFWKLEAQRLRSELHVMQELLNYKKDLKVSAITSQMIIPLGAQHIHKGFLDVGSKTGIQKDSIVISAHGLVGKVVSIGHKTAEVMLLTHPLSSVPVYVERSNAVGVLKGDTRQGLVLDYFLNDQLEEGDRLLTSGQGGVFPRGINVAVVEKKDATVKVRLIHQPNSTVFVYVLSPIHGELNESVHP
jgi:rod shape-determining protein MreC